MYCSILNLEYCGLKLLVRLVFQRKAICGYEGCKERRALYRDRSRWDQAAEVGKSHENIQDDWLLAL